MCPTGHYEELISNMVTENIKELKFQSVLIKREVFDPIEEQEEINLEMEILETKLSKEESDMKTRQDRNQLLHKWHEQAAVSYTHLTLPTILLV